MANRSKKESFKPSGLRSDIADDKAVRFGQAAVLRPSSGKVNTNPLPTYQEDEEGRGKRYRKKQKLERQERKTSRSTSESESPPIATKQKISNAQRTSTKKSSILQVEEIPAEPNGHVRSSQQVALNDAPVLEKKVRKSVFRRLSNWMSRLASTTPTEPVPVALSAKSVSKLAQSIPLANNEIKKSVITKHVIRPSLLAEIGQEISKSVPDHHRSLRRSSQKYASSENSEPDTTDTDENEQYFDEDFDDFEVNNVDEKRIASFVELLGVDPHLPYRDATEVSTDQERIESEKRMSITSKSTNAAILEGMDLDNLDVYDDEFFGLWDLEAGDEMLHHMASQTESYQEELTNLEKENRKLEIELNQLRRKKQDAFFHIKDLETEANEAERRYHRLLKQTTAKTSFHKLTNWGAVSNLLEQREELFLQERESQKLAAEQKEKIRHEEFEVDKQLNEAARIYQDAVKRLKQGQRETVFLSSDLMLIQRELNYLAEEIGLYVFENDKPHNLKMSEAFKYLAAQNPNLVPLKENDPTKRLAVLERALGNLKTSGSEQMQKVDDSHDELHWHLSRRVDILKNLIKNYMQEKKIIHIDSSIWKTLLNQETDSGQLAEQLHSQRSITTLLEPKWNVMKEQNAHLRAVIVRLNNIRNEDRNKNIPSAKTIESDKSCVNDELVNLEIQSCNECLDSGDEVWDDLSCNESLSWKEPEKVIYSGSCDWKGQDEYKST